MNSKQEYLNKPFSHIYVERGIRQHIRTVAILEHFPDADVIEIDHYKDVFCRTKQDYERQHDSQSLILAEKTGRKVYEGAKVCQSFGNEHFYYTSCIMNCLYDCEYCYLKGMYPSGNMVVFVNIEDIFAEVEDLLEKHDVYLCVSYDTDLMPLEAVTGYAGEWMRFAAKHCNGLKIEIRTKSGYDFGRIEGSIPDNVIIAYTLSPEPVIKACEHGTASFDGRLNSAKSVLMRQGQVRLCFDPVIYCRNWKSEYEELIRRAFHEIPADKVSDVSLGSFRISQTYLKKMRKAMPDSAVVQFPYENTDEVYHYPAALMKEMEDSVREMLLGYIAADKLFLWDE